jgi:hypothetical protein
VGGRKTNRAAAIGAAAIAVPLALLVGVLMFAAMGGFARAGGGTSAPTAAAPQPRSTSPLTVAAPTLAPRAETVCRALLSQLPEVVRQLPRRPVSAGPEQNAAYGDPAITLACGGPAPTFAATDTVYVLGQVCWHAAPQADGTLFTTVDREVPVRVSVPAAYDQAGWWANEFSAPVIAAVPSASHIPFGCR